MTAFPKPVRRPPKHARPLRAKSWGVRRQVADPRPSDVLPLPKPRRETKTKHGRRERGFGKMAYLRTLPCPVPQVFTVLFGALTQPRPGPCCDVPQVMHLGYKADAGGRRQAHDADTCKGCRTHHLEIDGKEGGHGRWYVAIGRLGQRQFRAALIVRGQAEWDALTPDEQAEWTERATAAFRAT